VVAEKESRRPAVTRRLAAAAVLVAILIVFIVENTRRTRIRFIVPIVTVPVWIALFAATVIGVVAGALIARHRRGAPE
jgi:uncharacterized integral membrane protein